MRHDVDACVVGVGSGGTLTGLSRFFNRVRPRRGVEMILADPEGSILYEYIKTKKMVEAGSWAVEGIGEDFIPDIADMSFVTDAFEIPDAESFAVARELLAQRRHPRRLLHRDARGRGAALLPRADAAKRVVTFVCDTGNKYLSKMYNDFWMAEQGFVEAPGAGRLERPHHAPRRSGRSHLGRA